MLEVTEYVPVSEGCKIGYVNVAFDTDKGKMTIERIVHLSKEGREWFAFPQYLDKSPEALSNGLNGRYRAFVGYQSPETNKQLLGAVAQAVKGYLDKKAQPKSRSEQYAEASGKEYEQEQNLPF